MRIFGKDILSLKIDKSAESYWITRVKGKSEELTKQ